MTLSETYTEGKGEEERVRRTLGEREHEYEGKRSAKEIGACAERGESGTGREREREREERESERETTNRSGQSSVT